MLVVLCWENELRKLIFTQKIQNLQIKRCFLHRQHFRVSALVLHIMTNCPSNMRIQIQIRIRIQTGYFIYNSTYLVGVRNFLRTMQWIPIARSAETPQNDFSKWNITNANIPNACIQCKVKLFQIQQTKCQKYNIWSRNRSNLRSILASSKWKFQRLIWWKQRKQRDPTFVRNTTIQHNGPFS